MPAPSAVGRPEGKEMRRFWELWGDPLVDTEAQAGHQSVEHHGSRLGTSGPEKIEGEELGEFLDPRDPDEVSGPAGGRVTTAADPHYHPFKRDDVPGQGDESDGEHRGAEVGGDAAEEGHFRLENMT